jgi:hypothetical protein
VVEGCKRIYLPLAESDDLASLELTNIYVALQADRSSPVERRAGRLMIEQMARGGELSALDDAGLEEIFRLRAYALRHRFHDPYLRAQLLAEQAPGDEARFHVAELVRRHRCLVLLGDPGSGKSTLARWLALQLAQGLLADEQTVRVREDHVRPDGDAGRFESLGSARLPVLVRLAEYAAARWSEPGKDSKQPLRYYLGEHLHKQASPVASSGRLHALIDDYLAAGQVTFILDGLDEVTGLEQRQAVAAEIETLIEDWIGSAASQFVPGTDVNSELVLVGNQLVVTSRIVGYDLKPLNEFLPHFVVQPMDKVAVERFCTNWAAAPQTAMTAAQGQALAAAVLEHPNPNVSGENGLGRNPLLLTILAQVYRQSPAEGLPARRSELYRRAERAVFYHRKTHWLRLFPQLRSEPQVRAMAAAFGQVTALVAYRLHANPELPGGLVGWRTLRTWLAEAVAAHPLLQAGRQMEELLEILREEAASLNGFFGARGQGVYGFLHRQFLEYFAARHLVEQCRPAGDSERWAPFLARLEDPNWREVLQIGAGLLEDGEVEALLAAILDAPDPTGGLLPHNLFIVAGALREVERPPATIVRRVAGGLVGAYRRDDEDRFAVLQQRVKSAFGLLPRQVSGAGDPAGAALVEALSGGDDGDAGRFQRLAAVELIVEHGWYTADVARALSAAWTRFTEPAGSLLVALQRCHGAQPGFFSARFLPFRRALAGVAL